MRGCSRRAAAGLVDPPVVPAHAGLFLRRTDSGGEHARRPRACGAVPKSQQLEARLVKSSRACGAVPQFGVELGRGQESSPRMRGCSLVGRQLVAGEPVVPAHAGLFPHAQSRTCPCQGRPRACGAVPRRNAPRRSATSSSPRMRGCSGVVADEQRPGRVGQSDTPTRRELERQPFSPSLPVRGDGAVREVIGRVRHEPGSRCSLRAGPCGTQRLAADATGLATCRSGPSRDHRRGLRCAVPSDLGRER